MDILSSLLNGPSPKSRKDAGKKPRRTSAPRRAAPAQRRGPRRELSAAEVVREALLRG